MKFEARSLGVFEILTPRQESQEVFDADRFRQAVNSLLERKVRQLVVDLSGIDYLYSDAINALVSINRRILEQAGRMSLLAPQPKVHEILMRSGLDSLFRIYKAEAELSAESMELLQQSAMISRSDRDTASSSGYQSALKTPAPIPEGPRARQHRRRSGARKDIAPRRPAGRNSVVPAPDSEHDTPYAEPSLTGAPGSTGGSSFPSTFSWDEKSAPPPAIPVPPPQSTTQPAAALPQPPAAPVPAMKPSSMPVPASKIPSPPPPPGSLSSGFEIVRGVSLPEDSVAPVDQPPPTFFPLPQVMDEDMPTMEFRVPPQGE